jgi:hypothetical protein
MRVKKNEVEFITNSEEEYWKIINLKRVSDTTGINRDKLYNNFRGLYSSLTPDDNKKVVDTITPGFKKILKRLGYAVKIEKLA